MNVFDYLFEQSSKLEKKFVLGSRHRISFNELFRSAIHLSYTLKLLVGENKQILILSDNSVNQIIVYLAILKSGNICVPLNPVIEKENLSQVLAKSGTKYAYVSKRYSKRYNDQFIDSGIRVLDDELISVINSEVKSENNEDNTDFNENRIAEIIFTSGSTGGQKGVQITHKNIIANTSSIVEYLRLTTLDTMEVVLPFYYCYGLSLLHTHLRVGGSIVLNNNFIFIGTLMQDINKYKCTGFAGVPSHYQILMRKTVDFKNTQFPSLRYVTQAGGKLHDVFIKEFKDAFPEIDFYVMYGQTEATARLSYLPPEKLEKKMGSIGKGIPGVILMVVNDADEQVQPNETGEIIAKGDNVMLGYLNDPDDTSKVLKNGWLYTGDLARVDDEGYIYIQSRKKEIIKVGGIRISPQEIEDVIVAYPRVISCSVESIIDDFHGEAVKAIVYINETDILGFHEDKMKKFCAKVLSTTKVPKFIVFETKLPYNSVGKKVK